MNREQFPVLHRKFDEALEHYEMIRPGDRVIIAVSGGKDSFTLFDLFCQYRETRFLGVDFLAMKVETDITCSGSIPNDVIEAQAKAHRMEWEVVYFPISEQTERPVDCFYCALRRRTALIKRAFESHYNRIAFGHHLDDIVETTVMNQLHHANISTMPPRVDLFKGKISIIRPLSAVLESECRDYAHSMTVIPAHDGCPVLAESSRRDTKDFFTALEAVEPEVKTNFYRALQRLNESSSSES